MRIAIGTMLAALVAASPATAQSDAFRPGRVIPDYGAVAPVRADAAIPPASRFRIAFDVSTAAERGTRSRHLESAARLLNMLAEAGIPPERVEIAIVIHGAAIFDVSDAATYRRRHDGAANANAGLVAALLRHGVDIQICGQSAAAYGVANEQFLPGLRIALSAMIAHALLQQQGYTLNPF